MDLTFLYYNWQRMVALSRYDARYCLSPFCGTPTLVFLALFSVRGSDPGICPTK